MLRDIGLGSVSCVQITTSDVRAWTFTGGSRSLRHSHAWTDMRNNARTQSLVSLCLVLPCRALSCFAALSCPLLFSSRSCLVLSCLLVSSCRVSSYLILSYLILSYLSRTQYLRRLSGYVQKLISAFWTIATLRTCVCYHIARVDTFPVMCG